MEGPLPSLTLVLGGVRSGKSAYAERLVTARGNGIYLATAEPRDSEMAERIRQHRERRGEVWTTVEETLDLLQTLQDMSAPDQPVLVDCLTLWLSNLMESSRDVDREIGHLVSGLPALPGPVVLVSNEVGLGLIADSPAGRHFVDKAGMLNQTVAMLADRVVFVSAGLPVTLKDVDHDHDQEAEHDGGARRRRG